MNDEKSICIITGAGFSKPAGLPIAKEIDSYFIRDNRGKILHFLSGENKWIDFANDRYKHNGRINNEYILWGYVLNQLVGAYIDRRNSFENYEEFYQFTIDLFQREEDVEDIFENARKNAEAENVYYSKVNPQYNFYLNLFKNIARSYLIDLINNLVGDLLLVRKKRDKIIDCYKPFIDKLANYKVINIITLNHDLLMETIITWELGRDFSDGFTRNQNILVYDGNPLNVFQNFFSEDITLIKLHGSIDMYKYEFFNELESNVKSTGEYLFFKTNNFREKQSPQRKNPDTGEIVQTFHRSISPQFIAGTRKDEIIAINELYKSLYHKFSEQITTAKELMIIGYSYSDKHVNEKIQNAINNPDLKCIININPNDNFPFYVPAHITVTNLKNIDNLQAD